MKKTLSIIPMPQKINVFGGEFCLNDAKVFFDKSLKNSVEYFLQYASDVVDLKIPTTDNIADAQICFLQTDISDLYAINCSAEGISVSAKNDSDCFFAVQTLLQLFVENNDGTITSPNCMISDNPKFDFRALHIDIARHFFPLDVLKHIVEIMSRVKLNKLHLHLTDDQGFRVEIKKYPKLNKIGSFRQGSEKVAGGRRFVDDTPHGGFLKKSEIQQLVEFAQKLQIEIIPELDIPGHAVALLAAYPEFSCLGENIEVRKKWGISKDLICAGNEKAYSFICEILDELAEMFPSEYFHLGGDEAPKDRWCNCPKCREMLGKLNLKNYDELQSYMLNFFAEYLTKNYGKKVLCWNDGLNSYSAPNIICHFWKPGTKGQFKKMVKNGRDAVVSPFFSLYFDYPYGMTPLKTTYNFNAERGIAKKHRSQILGVEGCLWTEHVSTEEKLFFNLMPRLLALSEVAWGTNKKNFAGFQKRALHFCKTYGGKPFVYNAKSLKKPNHRSFKIIKTFFKKDADIELHLNNTAVSRKN